MTETWSDWKNPAKFCDPDYEDCTEEIAEVKIPE
jgi:hypothetical protein